VAQRSRRVVEVVVVAGAAARKRNLIGDERLGSQS
jgi:hypothetical protein